MAFAFRILITFGKFAIILILSALILYATVWLINKLVQLVADGLGYEVTDFFQWLRSKLPEKKEKTNGKKS